MARNLGPSKSHVKLPHEITQVCADCSANGAEWASINRGVLVCSDCCSVHRSLGRHVSEIKFIHDKDWHPHTWNLVSLLSSGGANGVWEHTLLDPTNSKNNKKKPLASDPVHPVKADFVRAKHQMLSYVLHPPSPSPPRPASCLPPVLGGEESREGGTSAGLQDDEAEALSQELHSSVRTANLETSLRLLAQGADPNYFHKGRGNYPLHVAATSGQAEQVELLLVYGATPHCHDTSHLTPAQAARSSGYSDIAARLADYELELVRRMLSYLDDQQTQCPPHSQPFRSAESFCAEVTDAGQFRLPKQLILPHQHATDAARQAREKLIKLPILLLEELAADLYDEVDRRELDHVWSRKRESLGSTGDRCDVPFLPVNPLLSSTRNQARQKLARLQEGELCSLIVDLLVEAERRATILTSSRATATAAAAVPLRPVVPAGAAAAAEHQAAEEDPVYDTVCEEDDYSLVETQLSSLAASAGHGARPPDQPDAIESLVDEPIASEEASGEAGANPSAAVLVSSSLTSSQQQVVTSLPAPRGSQVSLTSPTRKPRVTSQEYERLLNLVDHSQRTIQQLQSENYLIKSQLTQLTTKVQQLRQENNALRALGSPSPPATCPPSHASSPYQSLPPLPNGNNAFSCNSSESCSSGHCFSSLPCHQFEPTSPHLPLSSQPRHPYTPSQRALPTLAFPPPPSEYSSPPPSLPYSPGSASVGAGSSPRTPFFNVLSSASNANKEWSKGRPFSMYDSRDQSRSGSAHWRSSPRDAADNNNDWDATSPTSAGTRGSAAASHQRSASFSENTTTTHSSSDLPSQAEVSALSTSIAAGIQELLAVVQAGDVELQPEKYRLCSSKISDGVRNMAFAFKKGRDGSNLPPALYEALRHLARTTVELNRLVGKEVHSPTIVENAYKVAKATKDIVSFFQ